MNLANLLGELASLVLENIICSSIFNFLSFQVSMIPYRSIFSSAKIAKHGEKLLYTQSRTFLNKCRTFQNVFIQRRPHGTTFPQISCESKTCLCGVQSPWRVHSRNMAGHAHWRNVKHIKEAADSKYASKVSGFKRRLQSAVKGSCVACMLYYV